MELEMKPKNYIEKQIQVTGRILGLANKFTDESPELARLYLHYYYNYYRKILLDNEKDEIVKVSDFMASDVESCLLKKLKINGGLN